MNGKDSVERTKPVVGTIEFTKGFGNDAKKKNITITR